MAVDLYGSGRRYVRVSELPRRLVSSALSIKYAPGARHPSTTTSFFTVGAVYGATTDIAAADTWATVCNVATGAGVLYCVVSPQTVGTASGIWLKIRVTKDGEVTEITWTADGTVAATDRLVLGVITAGSDIASANPAGLIMDPNGNYDDGFVTKKGGLPYLSNSGIIRPDWSDTLNLPAARYESSLKVEVKASNYSATAPNKSALAIYTVE